MLGQHHRSRRHSRPDGERFVSVCSGCGKQMIREESGDWVIDKSVAPE